MFSLSIAEQSIAIWRESIVFPVEWSLFYSIMLIISFHNIVLFSVKNILTNMLFSINFFLNTGDQWRHDKHILVLCWTQYIILSISNPHVVITSIVQWNTLDHEVSILCSLTFKEEEKCYLIISIWDRILSALHILMILPMT